MAGEERAESPDLGTAAKQPVCKENAAGLPFYEPDVSDFSLIAGMCAELFYRSDFKTFPV